MNFGQAIGSGFRNYVTFSGRAARAEYWYWTLFSILVALVSGIIDGALLPDVDTGLFGPLTSLVLLLPSIAIAVRRLHDIDRSGWWILIAFTVIGIIVLIAWDCIKGENGPNRFGPDPLASV